MLLTRVITALILLTVLGIILVWGETNAWLAFVAITLLGSFWEWGRLAQISNRKSFVYAIAGTTFYLVVELYTSESVFVFPLLALSGVFWVGFVPWCLRHVSIGSLKNPILFLLSGLILMPAAGLALNAAQGQGVIFLLSVVAICWAADIFAYVFGKLWGKRKLAPRISPGKSWEGAIGGTLTVIVLSWLVVYLASQFPVLENTWQYQASQQWPAALFTLWLIALSAMSIVGDLFESLLKRRVNLKDSSRLLPGHGGILDRIDAQLPVLPLAMLLLGATGAL